MTELSIYESVGWQFSIWAPTAASAFNRTTTLPSLYSKVPDIGYSHCKVLCNMSTRNGWTILASIPLPIVFVSIHLAYRIGTLVGLIKAFFRKIHCYTILQPFDRNE